MSQYLRSMVMGQDNMYMSECEMHNLHFGKKWHILSLPKRCRLIEIHNCSRGDLRFAFSKGGIVDSDSESARYATLAASKWYRSPLLAVPSSLRTLYLMSIKSGSRLRARPGTRLAEVIFWI